MGTFLRKSKYSKMDVLAEDCQQTKKNCGGYSFPLAENRDSSDILSISSDGSGNIEVIEVEGKDVEDDTSNRIPPPSRLSDLDADDAVPIPTLGLPQDPSLRPEDIYADCQVSRFRIGFDSSVEILQ